MGWSGHKFNKNGDTLWLRGGSNGFSGAFLKVNKVEIQIEDDEIFESAVLDKLTTLVRRSIENMDDRELLERFLKVKLK